MQIQINSDHNITCDATMADRIRGVVENALNHSGERITRVEVHLSDENAAKGGPADKRCMMEARLGGRQPVAVTDQAATMDQAIDGAAHKLARLIEHTLERLRDQQRHQAGSALPAPDSAPDRSPESSAEVPARTAGETDDTSAIDRSRQDLDED